ncbi:hypothetical protein BDV38DRAFT_235171 [Aspergillus pseudotamarii]|uniref:Uncharacterized protein n=1 Tax=Aspergillus pseudotamarii TaxID=132259 RepID=A0A5N6T8H7_ASPPS|nr:uncharacterized protein BDV38DRAFT_235171 [Aspergillus pseudotamarii]KAE8142580.1 hypothetical protein BDV38DRAFT_235171 [Aspergillus pseudotamarii]
MALTGLANFSGHTKGVLYPRSGLYFQGLMSLCASVVHVLFLTSVELNIHLFKSVDVQMHFWSSFVPQ